MGMLSYPNLMCITEYERRAMDKDLAKFIALTAFKSSKKLTDLVPFLKEHCGEAEYKCYGRALAAASAEISLQVLNKVFTDYPDIKQDFESKMQKYDRVF